MTSLQSRVAWGLVAVTVAAFTLTPEPAEPEQKKAPHEFLGADTVAYFSQDGSLEHDAAWKKTAAYKATHESGLMDVFEKLGDYAKQMLPPGGPEVGQLEQGMEHIVEHGVSGGISMNEAGMPAGTLVLHDGAEMVEPFVNLVNGTGAPIQFEEKEIAGRTVFLAVIPEGPGIDVVVMSAGGHMVLGVGVEASGTVVALANGETPNLSENKIWKKYNHGTATGEATAVGWFDMQTVSQTFGGFPLPETSSTVADLLQALGLHNVKTLAFHTGYKGPALWSEGHVDIEGERQGLMALASNKTFTLEDLPPLPVGNQGFTATRVDMAQLWDRAWKVVNDVVAISPPQMQEELSNGQQQVQDVLGFNPKTALFEPLGDLACVYTDPEQGLLGMGTGVVISVDDADKFSLSMKKIIDLIREMSDGQVDIRRQTKRGRELITFRFAKQAEVGAVMIDKNWVVAGLMPQTCEAFALRLDGKLPRWKPNAEQAAAFATMPREFSSVALGDPRLGWSTLMKIAPAVMVGLEVAAKEEGMFPEDMVLPIGPADIPPAELVTKPLFPNLTIATVDRNGLHTTSRQSLPGIPYLGGGADGSSVASSAVLVGLLLPAIQQAREAARRTQSSNNLKQLALAMHNYHDVHRGFPAGAHPNEKLKADKRFSWLARILPYMEQNGLYEQLDFEEAWDDESNRRFVQTNVNTLQNPGLVPGVPGQTHYAGLAGVGEDGPRLAANHKRAGVFADNRRTRIRDIRDGTSNTAMIAEVKEKLGSWAAGGNATYRPITQKPYINGPDGIGGPYRGGANFAFADGSVRFISENIDPEVFEALNTINGGEVINNLDF